MNLMVRMLTGLFPRSNSVPVKSKDFYIWKLFPLASLLALLNQLIQLGNLSLTVVHLQDSTLQNLVDVNGLSQLIRVLNSQ